MKIYNSVLFLNILNICISQLIIKPDDMKADNEESVPRVINGWPAKQGDVPYQIAFKASISRRLQIYATFCGGTIIAPSKMLSAAHCFVKKKDFCDKLCAGLVSSKPRELTDIYAVAGNLKNRAIYSYHDSDDEGQWRALKNVTFPDKYEFPKYDIAIVFTYTPFQYNSHVGAIPYASKFMDYHGRCLVSGFGRISSTVQGDKLLLADLKLISRHLCSWAYGHNTDHLICTYSYSSDVGKGDSGGPLVCKGTGDANEGSSGILVGIVSGHLERVCSFFTRVSDYHDWIERNRGQHSSCFSLWMWLLYAKFLLF